MREMYNFKTNSISQQKKALGLQFSVDHKGMMSLLELMLVPYLILSLIQRFFKVIRPILDELDTKGDILEPLNKKNQVILRKIEENNRKSMP